MPFHRRTLDAQPTHPCDVLLASDGRQDFSSRAVARAAALGGEGRHVGVVTIAKIYGSSFGIPHPGLLPTKDELTERQRWVAGAIHTIKRKGAEADGQVAATRRASKKLAAVALARGAKVVVIDETPTRGPRRIVEGDVGSELRRRLRKHDVAVEVIPAGAPSGK